MSKEIILDLCRQLRLASSIAEYYHEIEAASHEEFLIKILTEALARRKIEISKRYIRQAGFEILKGLDSFDYSNIVLPSQLTPALLETCEFVDKKQNLILYGQPGTGKTHLATALGVQTCLNSQPVLYYKTSKLVNHLVELKKMGKEDRFWKRLEKAALLILDEWGYLPFERLGTQMLFEVISNCYERRSVILTTNLPFNEWNTIFYDQKLTAAILDRMVHHGLLIMHEGESYRLRHSSMQ
ncbi:AAA family ATPase [Atopobacter sp. AH10]|uniref:IS21-like element helper ATPase IstB n=2 Tax=Atopobacter sp. AH10 TaxID=2315861 RepID=UPI000EF1E914|nr:IS21-like element helper ATPase IstB [Atopobacter sp. AH10]RLK63762.1 AAA family ATPase [Atopobacter sp. AH10]